MKEIAEAITRLNRLYEKVKQEHWENPIVKCGTLMGIKMAISKLIAYREELKANASSDRK